MRVLALGERQRRLGCDLERDRGGGPAMELNCFDSSLNCEGYEFEL